MMKDVFLETLSNVNIGDPSHDKMSVTGWIYQNAFKCLHYFYIIFKQLYTSIVWYGNLKNLTGKWN